MWRVQKLRRERGEWRTEKRFNFSYQVAIVEDHRIDVHLEPSN